MNDPRKDPLRDEDLKFDASDNEVQAKRDDPKYALEWEWADAEEWD